MKLKIRSIGIDDFPFDKQNDKFVKIVGIVYRADKHIDGVLSSHIKVDGNDSTDVIIKMINTSKYKSIIKVIFLKGITLGGLNIIDIDKLYKKTNISVIVVMRKKPKHNKLKKTLIKLGMSDKLNLVNHAGIIYKLNKRLFVQIKGLNLIEAKQLISLFSNQSVIPEPIRIAHLIGSGVVLGESHGDV